MLRLNIVIASTRPGRVGPSVAKWFDEIARKQGAFEVHLVDLADFKLPIYDEPHHPRARKYEHEHTKRWSASAEAADAFVFVTPEYNYSPTPALLNALDYLYEEWAYKPCAFVSYGGVSGGLRAVQTTKLTMSSLRLVPIPEAVTIPAVSHQLKDGVFEPNDQHIKSAEALLAELKRWAEALKPLRG